MFLWKSADKLRGSVEPSEYKHVVLSLFFLKFASDKLSSVQIMERLGLSHRPIFRKNYLRTALNMGLIEMTIPDKPNSRNQKYRKR